jgi:hypothetical protein
MQCFCAVALGWTQLAVPASCVLSLPQWMAWNRCTCGAATLGPCEQALDAMGEGLGHF